MANGVPTTSLVSGSSSWHLAALGDGGDDRVELVQGLQGPRVPAGIVAASTGASHQEVLDVLAGARHGQHLGRQHLLVAAVPVPLCSTVRHTLLSDTPQPAQGYI